MPVWKLVRISMPNGDNPHFHYETSGEMSVINHLILKDACHDLLK